MDVNRQGAAAPDTPRTEEEMLERIERLEDELRRSHRLILMGTIAGTIAHEFNNLLTPVLSYAQLALQSPEDRELTRKALSKAVDTTERASELAASLLGFIRHEGDAREADVGAVVSDALACLVRGPEKDGIDVRLNLSEECTAAIRPIALQQVLVNLLLNACQAMQGRGGRLTVESECSTWNMWPGGVPEHAEPSGEIVVLTVMDTGRGIEESLLGRVFEPFVTSRAAGGSGSGEEGNGLGLAICRQLVQEAGGRIRVESEVGRGTRFEIALPRSSRARARRAA